MGFLVYMSAASGALYVAAHELRCDGTIKSGNAMVRVFGFAGCLGYAAMLWAWLRST